MISLTENFSSKSGFYFCESSMVCRTYSNLLSLFINKL